MTQNTMPQDDEPQARLEAIIERMQKIQRAIRASGQPASMRELAELRDLGEEYARVIERLANPDTNAGLA
ncbi:MAG: hypothetical protein PVJ66_04685 [Gammaproteobacteria bacterium]